MNQHQKSFVRILIAAALFLPAFLVDHIVSVRWYIALPFFIVLYLFIGWDILWKAVRGILRGQFLDENFLMCVATIGAFCVQEFAEAVAVMLFYQVGELFQGYAVAKSRRSIASLMDIRPDVANLADDEGNLRAVSPETVRVGDMIAVRPGERIPLDGVVVRGSGVLNTAALTGESAPVSVGEGQSVLSGSISVDGLLYVRCEKEFYDSTVSKILDLVENASAKKAKAENFITRFAKFYTPAVVSASLLLAIVPSLVWGNWSEWIRRALVFLVVSCPCALVISVPMSFFGGLGAASRQGILIKGGNYLELLDRADTFVFDKTGTLTKGTFAVTEVLPESKRESILYWAAVAESVSTHPIAQSVLRAAGEPKDRAGYVFTEVAGMGVVARKGEDVVLAGNLRLLEQQGVAVPEDAIVDRSGTVIYVAYQGAFMGSIVISDEPKEDSAFAVAALKASGCRTIMLTGDNQRTAAAVADRVGVDEYRASLLPQDKVAEVEKLLEEKKGRAVAFVGDGINDAPVLMRADLGIAMGGLGSDSAVEAADVVLMHDNPAAIVSARKCARRTMHIVRENVIFALAVKAIVLGLSAVGIAGMWPAVFADVGVSVLAVLNAMRLLRFRTPSPRRIDRVA